MVGANLVARLGGNAEARQRLEKVFLHFLFLFCYLQLMGNGREMLSYGEVC